VSKCVRQSCPGFSMLVLFQVGTVTVLLQVLAAAAQET
jgi:hypothetical protein